MLFLICVVRIFKIYFLRNFQVNNILLTTVTILNNRCPDRIHLITRSLYPQPWQSPFYSVSMNLTVLGGRVPHIIETIQHLSSFLWLISHSTRPSRFIPVIINKLLSPGNHHSIQFLHTLTFYFIYLLFLYFSLWDHTVFVFLYLISLSMVFFRFIHAIENGRISIFWWLSLCACMYIYIFIYVLHRNTYITLVYICVCVCVCYTGIHILQFFIHSNINGCLGYFMPLWIMLQ